MSAHPTPRLPLSSPPVALLALLGALTLVVGCGADENVTGGGNAGALQETSSKNGADSNPAAPSTENKDKGGEGGQGGFASDAGSTQAGPPVDPGTGNGDNSGGPNGGTPGEGSGGGVADAGSTSEPAPQPDATGADVKDGGAGVCNKSEPVVLYLSADDSNSMAGATVARALIDQGQYAYKALRTYEFLNYYDFAYPAAKKDEVAVSAQMRKAPEDRYHLQIGVRAPDFTVQDRRRLNLVLAVDTSSSMGWGVQGNAGIDLARSACMALAKSLGKDDVFTLISWGGEVKTVIDGLKVSGPMDKGIVTACAELNAKGVSNFSAGLAQAYAAAKKSWGAERINRVVILSDGGANVGEQDEKLVAEAAKDADKEAIYLMGIGVGDAWNYNDKLMNAVTDAGKGAYVFFDSHTEAAAALGPAFLRHVELAAREVQVELTLPPTFEMDVFHGEQYSTVAKEVEPQHLAANDAMVFHQVLRTCAPDAIDKDAVVKVKATWLHPLTKKKQESLFEAKIADLIAADSPLLRKGDAVVAYAEALAEVRTLKGADATKRIDQAIEEVKAAVAKLPQDSDLQEIADLLLSYRAVFETGQSDKYPQGGTGADPIDGKCGKCQDTGDTLENLRCALDLCDDAVLLGQSYSSPTGSKTAGTFAAVSQFGTAGNDLKPQVGKSYALMATGPATGTQHSVDLGGSAMKDKFTSGGAQAFNVVEWTLKLKAPAGANGLRVRHVFFSQEYDEYVGSQFNDKFYMVLKAGSTNGGAETVINYTNCRAPDQHHDFVCSPGMQFCNPRQRYCYIAINTAASECCWLGGCPNGKATTDISGTGYSCAASQSNDSANSGSSTGWMVTEWPIEPGEEFELTFHLHDTGDGIYDSEVILDGLQFVGSVTPGTWSVNVPL